MNKKKFNKSVLLFKVDSFIGLFLVVLLLSFSQVESKKNQKHLQGVIILNQQNFNQALQDFQILIVSFQEQSCQYCSEFKLTYAMIAEKYNQNLVSQNQREKKFSKQQIQLPLVQFGKLKFNEQTSHIFESHNIQLVPSVRIFLNGKLIHHQFQSLNYGDEIIQDCIEWIVRSLTQIHQIQQVKSIPEYLISIIINCDSEYMHSFNQLRIKNLNYNFYCTHQRQVSQKTQIAIYQKNKKIHSISLLQKDSQKAIDKQNRPNLQTHNDLINFEEKLQSFFNRQIYVWNNDMIHQIFSKNKSAFILIVNNQTRSQQVFQYYIKIKNQFNENNQNPTIKFIVTNLAQTPQQTTKIKRFLFGSIISGYKFYPYPILAYLKMGQYYRVSKYIFTHDMKHQIKFEQMQNWMMKVVNKLELTEEQKKNSQNQKTPPIQQWFIKQSESIFKQQLSIKNIQPNNSMRSISHRDLKNLLISKNSTQPFLVYFSWRNDFECVTLQEQIRSWWVNKEDKQQQQQQSQNQKTDQTKPIQMENKYSKNINLYVFNLNFNDYPNFENLQIDYVPSLFYFSKDKKIQKLHGITQGLNQVKQFIQKFVDLPHKDNQETFQKLNKDELQNHRITQKQQEEKKILLQTQQQVLVNQLNQNQINNKQILTHQVAFANQKQKTNEDKNQIQKVQDDNQKKTQETNKLQNTIINQKIQDIQNKQQLPLKTRFILQKHQIAQQQRSVLEQSANINSAINAIKQEVLVQGVSENIVTKDQTVNSINNGVQNPLQQIDYIEDKEDNSQKNANFQKEINIQT